MKRSHDGFCINSTRNRTHPKEKDIFASVCRLEPDAQLDLWKKIIDSHPFNLDQLMSLKAAIDDKIRLDIISSVPYEIALYITSFLAPKDLCNAAQTCRSWRILCEDNRLWREKCKEEGLLSDDQTLDILFKKQICSKHLNQERYVNQCLISVPKHEWKLAFLKHISIIRNWRTRKFNTVHPFIVPNSPQTPSSQRRRPQQQSTSDQESSIDTLESAQNNEQELLLNSASSLESQRISINESNDNVPIDVDHPESNAHTMQLRCHDDCVITCLQYNPRTNIIVSGSDDQTLKVWSSVTGRCITTLEGHAGGVWSSQLSPDDIVISGSTDRTLKVWRAQTGELIHTLVGHSSTVRCLALDGDQVVSGSRDTTLRCWDIKEGTCLHVFTGHSAAVRCVEYKDGKIVSGAYDYLVMVWDAKTGTCCHSLECHQNRIYCLQFDGKTIASGSLDTTICIWDAEKGKLRHRFIGHTSLTSKMQLKGNILVSANADSFCKVWDINSGKCLQTLGDSSEYKHTSAITSVYFDNRHVVTSSDDGTVKLWDIKTGQFIRDLVVLPTASKGGVIWRVRASYTKLICAVGSRTSTEDTHLLVLDFNE